jgi:hypothetical protein
MHNARQVLVVILTVITAVSSAFAADQHVVSPQQLSAAINGQLAQQDADRAAIREALARPQVSALARKMAIDMARAAAVADTLTGPELAQTAQAARQVNEQLAGGASTIVISTTTIIIVLLLLILLIVIIKS